MPVERHEVKVSECHVVVAFNISMKARSKKKV